MTETTETTPAAATSTTSDAIPLPDEPGVILLHHALIDLSVENPHGYLKPELAAEIAPEYETDVRVSPAEDNPGAFRVDVMARLSARAGLRIVFVAEVTYRAEVQLHQVTPENTDYVLQVEVPSAMYPTLKDILETGGRFAGYPGMQVEGLDFEAAYAARKIRGS